MTKESKKKKKQSETNVKESLDKYSSEQKKVSSSKEQKVTRSSSRRYVDTESWVEKHLDDLISIFNLNMLELSLDEAKTIAIKLVDILRGEASVPDKDSIRRRFGRYTQNMYQIITQLILELREDLLPSQIEFVVNNIGEAVLNYAPKIYREVVKNGREDLLDTLRAAWRTHWTAKRYSILPVECPRCRFNSIMPDLSCIVCGSTISEEELKKNLDFEKMLKDFVNLYSEEDVMKTIMYGYVYVNSLGLKPPTHERDKLDIELLLSSKEKEIVKSLLSSIKGGN